MAHINLTPASILLTDEGMPKLFDFQLMDVVEQWDERESAAMLKPAFSPPEDFERERHSVLPAADVYRVGVAMYMMLTGQPPFSGNTALEIVQAVLSRPPARPRQMNSAVPRSAEKVCLKCLEKRPEHRYHSLQELAGALGRLVKAG
jgi:serine/threonine protein kinase